MCSCRTDYQDTVRGAVTVLCFILQHY